VPVGEDTRQQRGGVDAGELAPRLEVAEVEVYPFYNLERREKEDDKKWRKRIEPVLARKLMQEN